jgi:plastocyanin
LQRRTTPDRLWHALLTAAFAGGAAFATLAAAPGDRSAAPIDWSSAARVELRMVEYEFVPSALRFRRDTPYQLHVVNAGKEGHDLTAPDFFNAVVMRDAGPINPDRTSIFLEPEQTADIYFVARDAGLFAPRCADHDWAGMKLAIVVD